MHDLNDLEALQISSIQALIYIPFHEVIWNEMLWAVPCVADYCARYLVWHILYQIYLELG